MQAALIVHYTGPKAHFTHCAKALVRLATRPGCRSDARIAVLQVIAQISVSSPGYFSIHTRSFAVFDGDAPLVRRHKLAILTRTISHANQDWVLRELAAYICSPDIGFAREAIRAYGVVSQVMPETATEALGALMRVTRCKNGTPACINLP
jgi:hypothetical protein